MRGLNYASAGGLGTAFPKDAFDRNNIESDLVKQSIPARELRIVLG
jgi:hypothetical protein